MSADIPRWMMRDPAEVYERVEITEQRREAKSERGKAETARRELEKLFDDQKERTR